MDDQSRETVLTLLRDTQLPVKQIAKQAGVSVATLYKEFPGGRGALQDSSASL
ncbi:hypothetical protein PB2503_02282 [Parvularcula bermudensis HTCC2503]|uniref:Resolvase HTH domain-containing protein n=2 Tax=Parvularcula TaxID=208215 RepID=E0TCA1_PARBH|nr:hypothetical protein PB2503_02282 [Parvularcula bermudensis HTCC2503]